MGNGSVDNTVVRFGPFEADLAARRLRKNGLKIRVQDLPFRILTMLLERPGEVVTREELQEKLWPAGTFVEFEHSLNTAVNKLRIALSDDAEVPRYVETIPRRGYRFIGTLERVALATQAAPTSNTPPVRWRWMMIAAGCLLGVSIAGNVGWWWVGRAGTGDKRPVQRFALETPEPAASAVVSPDGRRVAFLTGVMKVWIQDLDRTEPRLVAGPGQYKLGPWITWSPDGKSIVFGDQMRLLKLSTAGGVPTVVTRSIGGPFGVIPSDWSNDGLRILFSGGPPQRAFEVSAQGGEPRAIDLGSGGNIEHFFPRYLPGPPGRRWIVYEERGGGQSTIVASDLDSRQRQVLAKGSHPFFSPTGHILYEASGSIWALPVSSKTMKAAGEAFLVEQQASNASASNDGTLAYIRRGGRSQQLVWRERDGREVGTIGRPQELIYTPSLSPDGTRVLAVGKEGGNLDIWVHDAARSITTRLTFDPADEGQAVWRPDGKRFSYSQRRAGLMKIFDQPLDGGGERQPLVASPRMEYAMGWSADDQYLVFDRTGDSDMDIWYARRKSGGGFEEVPFVKTEFDELVPSLSHDGRFLAYQSNKSGRYEIYVRTFPAGDREWLVSPNGGRQPRWRKDGRELFYVESEDMLMATPVTTSNGFSSGAPRKLFQHADTLRGRGNGFDVSADGQRFVVIKVIQQSSPVIRVVQNWLDGR